MSSRDTGSSWRYAISEGESEMQIEHIRRYSQGDTGSIFHGQYESVARRVSRTRLTDFLSFFTTTIIHPPTVYIKHYTTSYSQTISMASSSSNKRQRMDSAAQYQHNSPHEYLDVPHYKDLPNQPLIAYEDIKTEADLTKIVEKLDVVDVKKLLAQTIGELNESNARKLLINAALSTEIIHIKTWGELTHIQLSTQNERALRI
jgi:hypothetical protein